MNTDSNTIMFPFKSKSDDRLKEIGDEISELKKERDKLIREEIESLPIKVHTNVIVYTLKHTNVGDMQCCRAGHIFQWGVEKIDDTRVPKIVPCLCCVSDDDKPTESTLPMSWQESEEVISIEDATDIKCLKKFCSKINDSYKKDFIENTLNNSKVVKEKKCENTDKFKIYILELANGKFATTIYDLKKKSHTISGISDFLDFALNIANALSKYDYQKK